MLPFHPSVQPIKRFICKKFKVSCLTLPLSPSLHNHRQLPLREMVSLVTICSVPVIPTPIHSHPWTFPCNRKRCNTCPVVSSDQLLSIQGPSFMVTDRFSCISTNVVYILSCKRCNILYVGETKRRLAVRITEHLRSIDLNLPGFPVATHFIPLST